MGREKVSWEVLAASSWTNSFLRVRLTGSTPAEGVARTRIVFSTVSPALMRSMKKLFVPLTGTMVDFASSRVDFTSGTVRFEVLRMRSVRSNSSPALTSCGFMV